MSSLPCYRAIPKLEQMAMYYNSSQDTNSHGDKIFVSRSGAQDVVEYKTGCPGVCGRIFPIGYWKEFKETFILAWPLVSQTCFLLWCMYFSFDF